MMAVITVRDQLLNVGVKFYEMIPTSFCIHRTSSSARVYIQFGNYTLIGQDDQYGNTGVFHQ